MEAGRVPQAAAGRRGWGPFKRPPPRGAGGGLGGEGTPGGSYAGPRETPPPRDDTERAASAGVVEPSAAGGEDRALLPAGAHGHRPERGAPPPSKKPVCVWWGLPRGLRPGCKEAALSLCSAPRPSFERHVDLPCQRPSASALPLLPHFSSLQYFLSNHVPSVLKLALMRKAECSCGKVSLMGFSKTDKMSRLINQTSSPPTTGSSRDTVRPLPFGSQCRFWSESSEYYTKSFPGIRTELRTTLCH